jgi:hypothetical protein
MILVLSINGFAQQNNDWITPFATVEFKENKIFYYHADDNMVSQLTPMFKPEYLMIINNLNVMFEPDEFQYWKEIISNITSDIKYPVEKIEDNTYFIKAFTLQTIWSINNKDALPSQQASEVILSLLESQNKTIANSAVLASDLFELVQNYYKSKN